jgi:hypothetical protein
VLPSSSGFEEANFIDVVQAYPVRSDAGIHYILSLLAT